MSTPTVAFFGATGDCAGYCLANSLNAGYDCIALARTPAKLTKSMKAKGVSDKLLDQHLTIVQGDVRDIEAVKKALQIDDQVVGNIVSGIGGVPALQWSLRRPVVLTDPTLCQDAGNTILRALTQLAPKNKPTYLNMSTTGIQPKGKPRDVPLLFVPLYHWLLIAPHEDKLILQQSLERHVQLPTEQRGISAFANVKASLLMDGEAKGLQAVRAGSEDKPAVGYTIRRSDVGLFMFEKMLKSGLRDDWKNKGVCVTY